MDTPGEKLVIVLDQLRQRLNNSGVERTIGLASHMSKDCGYYKKSLGKFLKQDYQDIRGLIDRASSLIQTVEGPSK